MSSQICLKWNSFLNNIATSFESLWEEEGLVDVTLASDGQCLTAHKVILSASSPFFKKVFQANPCQHPVIILQDVHFTELEALLIFIYKGEVNIEQKNLPALLKAAETLQIRGLTGGDVMPVESYSNLNDPPSGEDTPVPASEEAPKKKHKSNHDSNVNSLCHSIIDKALIPKKSRQSSECLNEKNHRDTNCALDSRENSISKSLPMKVEPFDVIASELPEHVENNANSMSRPNTALSNETQGPRDSPNEDLGDLAGMPGYRNPKPIHAYQQLPYADLLPSPDVISTWASSRPLDHLACDIMKILFSHEERIVCNVNGKMGKQQFDSNKIHLIREVLLHYSGLTHNSVEWEEVWKNCVTKIDTSNRGLKRYLFQRRSVYTQ